MPNMPSDDPAKAFVFSLKKIDDVPAHLEKTNQFDKFKHNVLNTETATDWEIIAFSLTTKNVKVLKADKLKNAFNRIQQQVRPDEVIPKHFQKGLEIQIQLLTEYQKTDLSNVQRVAETKKNFLVIYSKHRNHVFINLSGFENFLTQHDGVNYLQANLSQSNLDHLRFKHADFRRANLRDSHLVGANFYNAALNEANLECATLTDANLQHAFLTKANLSNADLTRTNFYEANLQHADLSGARIDETDFSKANLTQTKFKKVDYQSAHFFSHLNMDNIHELKNELEVYLEAIKGNDEYSFISCMIAEDAARLIMSIADQDKNLAEKLLADAKEVVGKFSRETARSQKTRTSLFSAKEDKALITLNHCERDLANVMPKTTPST